MTNLFTRGTRNAISDDVMAGELRVLDAAMVGGGIERLSVEQRYVLFSALAELPLGVIDNVRCLSDATRAAIRDLDRAGYRTYSRVAAALLAPLVSSGEIYRVDRAPLPDGPAAIFVPNVGGQYPVRGGTVGNSARRVLGIQPPIGSFYVASWLALLGVEIRAFNLELGQSEYDACEAALAELGERTYFFFSTSNFFGATEIESMYLLSDMCNSLRSEGIRPRLVGAGYSSYFCRDEYLEYTPVEVVVGPHGEPSEADMIFSSAYIGPRDERPSRELFGHIPNLFFRADEGGGIVSTPMHELTTNESRILGGALDVRLMQLNTKYWSPTNIMDVCAPDDLNIPLELAPGAEETHTARTAAPRERRALSLSNYVHRPNSIKMMTVFGSCPRGCQFCQLTQWGERLYFYTGDEAVAAMNAAAATYPDLQMFIFEDDDFLLRRSHVDELVASLRRNEPTKGKIFYVSTVPMEIDPGAIFDLREVGFRAMLLGLETPVERVARQIGKFSPRYSFEHILEAPRIAHDGGLHVRVTAIPFYPLLREPELAEVIEGLTGFLTYGTGISVAVHPIVRAAPGVELVKSGAHAVMKREYALPDGSGRTIDLLQYVLPDDLAVRDVAFRSVATAGDMLAEMLDHAGITNDDFPSSLGVLALFRSTVEAWRTSPRRTVDGEVLDRLDATIDAGIVKMLNKHAVLSDVQEALRRTVAGADGAAVLRARLTDSNAAYVNLGLRMAADFGDNDETLAAVRLAAVAQSEGFPDWSLHQSLHYACLRPMSKEVRSELETLLAQLEEPPKPHLRQRSPKLIPLVTS